MKATSNDHIAMEVGDEFYVIGHDTGTGWTRVLRMMTGKIGEEGIVPTAFVDMKQIEM